MVAGVARAGDVYGITGFLPSQACSIARMRSTDWAWHGWPVRGDWVQVASGLSPRGVVNFTAVPSVLFWRHGSLAHGVAVAIAINHGAS